MSYDIKDFLKKFFSSRLFVLAAVFIVFFGIILARIFTLQVVNGKSYQENFSLKIQMKQPIMRHPRQTEDTQRLVVDLVDAAPVVDGQQPRAGALHDEPVIALAFLGAQLGPHDDLADTVQRHVERPFAAGDRKSVV